MDYSSTSCPTDDITAIILVLVVFGVVILLSLIPTIFYLVSLQKALGRCQLPNRSMQPGMVWLLLIPFFSLIWHFIVVNNIAESLDREFASRNMVSEPMPGKSVGLAMCILSVCGLIPYVGMLAGIGQLVCWIIYWVKISGCSTRLAGADFQRLEAETV